MEPGSFEDNEDRRTERTVIGAELTGRVNGLRLLIMRGRGCADCEKACDRKRRDARTAHPNCPFNPLRPHHSRHSQRDGRKLKPNGSLLSRTLNTLTLCRVPDTRENLWAKGEAGLQSVVVAARGIDERGLVGFAETARNTIGSSCEGSAINIPCCRLLRSKKPTVKPGPKGMAYPRGTLTKVIPPEIAFLRSLLAVAVSSTIRAVEFTVARSKSGAAPLSICCFSLAISA
jgi:hypothetical protein